LLITGSWSLVKKNPASTQPLTTDQMPGFTPFQGKVNQVCSFIIGPDNGLSWLGPGQKMNMGIQDLPWVQRFQLQSIIIIQVESQGARGIA
jgi:hypothetical protein